MNFLSFNQIIVALFLLATLLLGLMTKRPKTMQGYVLANNSLGIGVLTLTLLSTIIGAGDLRHAGHVYQGGLIDCFIPLAFFSSFLATGLWIAPKMRYFKGCFTMGEVMGRLYNRWVHLFTGLISLVFSVLIVGAQLEAMGSFAHTMLHVSTTKTIILLGLAVTLYSIIGGMRSVAITDVVQFISLAISLVVLANALIYKVGFIDLFKELPAKKLSFSSIDFLYKVRSYLFWAIIPTYLISPPIVQRMLMIKDKQEAKNMFFTAGSFYLAVRFLLVIIGFGAIVYCKDDGLAEMPNNLLAHLSGRLFADNQLVQSILLMGFLAIFMSTADSFLHTAGIIFTNDIARHFIGSKKISEIKWARISTVILGTLSIFVGIWGSSLLPNALNEYMVTVMATVLFPFIIGVLGLKTNVRAFTLFILSFSLSFVITHWVLALHQYTQLLISLAIAIFAFLVGHYSAYGSFVWVNYEEGHWQEARWQPSWAGLQATLHRFCTTPLRLATMARRQVTLYGSEPLLFSLFIVITNMVVNFTTTAHPMDTFLLSAIIHGIGTLLCAGLMLQSNWPASLKGYFDLYWLFTVGYCVAFSGVFLFLDDPNNPVAVVKLTIMILLLIVLVDWRSFLWLLTIGGGLALALHHVGYGTFFPALTFTTKWTLCWGTLPAVLVGLLFARRKQRSGYQQTTALKVAHEDKIKQWEVEMAAHQQLARSLDRQSSMMSVIHGVIKGMRSDQYDLEATDRLADAVAHLADIRDKSMEYLPLAMTVGSLKKMLDEVGLELKRNRERVVVKLEQKQSRDRILGDLPYIKKLMTNAIDHLLLCGNQVGVVHCSLDDVEIAYSSHFPATRCYRLTVGKAIITDRPKGYTPENIQRLFFKKGEEYLHENARIAHAHYGIMQLEKQGDNLVQTYVIPYNPKEVKPKIEDFADEGLIEAVRLDTPEDKAFLDLVKQEKRLDFDLIKRAFRVCKHYHRNQDRNSGELFYTHPREVAKILLAYTHDTVIILAGLLHDTVEDTALTLHQIGALFGKEVATIVEEVTNLYNKEGRKIRSKKQDVFTALLAKANTKSLLIKLADRLHNMRTLSGHPSPAKRQTIAQETEEFFIPVAQQIGMKLIEMELKVLCKEYN